MLGTPRLSSWPGVFVLTKSNQGQAPCSVFAQFHPKGWRPELFPILRSATVRIRPPERVAISQQQIRGYKWSEARQKREPIQESIIVREMAHAAGPMTVFLQIPQDAGHRMHRLLQAVPYWGQSSSLTSCLGVRSTAPLLQECALPLDLLDDTAPLRPYFTYPVTEFHATGSRGSISPREARCRKRRHYAATSMSGQW